MQKNWFHIYDKQQVFASFLEGFTSFSNPLAYPSYMYDIHKNVFPSLIEDQINLHSDLVKSYRRVVGEAQKERVKQLSLNLDRTDASKSEARSAVSAATQ